METSMLWMVVIVFGAIIVLMSMGMWVGLAIGAVGIIAIIFLAEMPQIIGTIMYKIMASYVMSAIPMFIFMGEIVTESGLAKRMYDGISKWTGILPGGLVHSNIASCAIFAAISGSSGATAAFIGSVAYPEQEKRNYDKRIVTGSLTAGSILGIMIPPSIGMIIYGAFVSLSVAKLFIATLIPGIVLAISFMIYIFIRFAINPSLGPKRQQIRKSYFKDAVLALKDVWPAASLILTIFVGIYGGFMTPTEAAAISGFVALCLAFAFGRLSFKVIKVASLKALEITAMLYLIVISAKILAAALAMLQVPMQLCQIAGASGLPPLVIWGFIIIMYLILGCLMDATSMMFLTLPVVYPLMMSLGFDPLWFGVVFFLALEAGELTPPIGLNLYMIQGITKVPFWEIVRGCIPFFIVIVADLWLFTFFPQLATWLPSTM